MTPKFCEVHVEFARVVELSNLKNRSWKIMTRTCAREECRMRIDEAQHTTTEPNGRRTPRENGIKTRSETYENNCLFFHWRMKRSS
jgi:hypothetical protein